MNSAVHTTLALILLIAIGLLLKTKISNGEQLKGIKILILSIALPAMIFVSLLKIQIEPSLLILPALALLFNLIMFGSTRFVLPLLGISPNTASGRTLMMLLPSLAPGLSCFPFLIEYWGEQTLAWAALSDVGNKFFGLVLLYLVAMHWYYKVQKERVKSEESRLKSLVISLIREPVNLALVAALLMLGLGLTFDALPLFLQDAVTRMRSLMTPLVLLYIGMAVKVKWKSFRMIGMLLCWRTGFTCFLSAAFIMVFSITEPGLIILAIVFPLSATSFWPFAHMSAVSAMEKQNGIDQASSTFDLDLGLAVLACSLPLSTSIILLICSSGTLFMSPFVLMEMGGLFLLVGIIPLLVQRIRAVQPYRRRAYGLFVESVNKEQQRST